MPAEEELRAKRAARMREWRAKNPEKARAIDKTFREKWKSENPDKASSYAVQWKRDNPEKYAISAAPSKARVRAKRAADPEGYNAYMRGQFAKWKGIPEREISMLYQSENPTAISLDFIRPDYYLPGTGFVEIKRALPEHKYLWREPSIHFPGLWFHHTTHEAGTKSLDEQVHYMPRPLTVIVFHALTGQEITRRTFE
jgi:hypothetical protein